MICLILPNIGQKSPKNGLKINVLPNFAQYRQKSPQKGVKINDLPNFAPISGNRLKSMLWRLYSPRTCVVYAGKPVVFMKAGTKNTLYEALPAPFQCFGGLY